MTLDLAQVAGQIAAMVQAFDRDLEGQGDDSLRDAWEAFDRASSRELAVDFQARSSLPAEIEEYTVAATDGSFILPNRHSPARYYLINVGRVILRYGSQSSAHLDTQPRLYYRDEDLIVPGAPFPLLINGTNVGPRRASDELCAVAALVANESRPAVALQDGSLVLWDLAGAPDYISKWVLPAFLTALDELRVRRQPVAGFVSSPASSELIARLRADVSVDFPFIADRDIFIRIDPLSVGERSAVYSSTARTVRKYIDSADGDRAFGISFFYLNVGYEIGRVEIPAWVASDPDLLNLVHWVIFDQCQLGRGYPVALQEAHELAVLSVQDRHHLELFIERELAGQDIVLTHTGKDGSKRGRFV